MADIFKPPQFGVRLLEYLLPPEVASHAIGDLEEEFRAMARQEGVMHTQKWFWVQVVSTLTVSIKEGWTQRLLYERAMTWCRRQAVGLGVSFNWDGLARQRIAASLAVLLALLCILMLYSLGLLTASPGRQLAHNQKATIPELNPPSIESSQTDNLKVVGKRVPATTRRPKASGGAVVTAGANAFPGQDAPLRDALVFLSKHGKVTFEGVPTEIARHEMADERNLSLISGNVLAPELATGTPQNIQVDEARSRSGGGFVETAWVAPPAPTSITSTSNVEDAEIRRLERIDQKFMRPQNAELNPTPQKYPARPERGCFL